MLVLLFRFIISLTIMSNSIEVSPRIKSLDHRACPLEATSLNDFEVFGVSVACSTPVCSFSTLLLRSRMAMPLRSRMAMPLRSRMAMPLRSRCKIRV